MLTSAKVFGLTVASLVILALMQGASFGHTRGKLTGPSPAPFHPLSDSRAAGPQLDSLIPPVSQTGRESTELPEVPSSTQTEGEKVEFVAQAGGVSYAVTVRGDHAYIGEGARLTILDITNPASPTVIGKTPLLPNVVQDVAVAGDYAYIANREAGLRVVNISDLTSPTEVGHYDTPGSSWGVAVDGTHAYVADGSDGGLRVIDVADPTNPGEVGAYDTSGWARGVVLAGGYAYVADGGDLDGGDVAIVDVSSPSNPTKAGHHESPWMTRDVAVVEDYAYIVGWNGGSGLQVVDISDPKNPVSLGTSGTLGNPMAVSVVGDHAYVAGHNLLQMVDVSDPWNPTKVGDCLTPGWAVDIVTVGNYAYMAAGAGDLRVLDIAEPAEIHEVGSYSSPGEGRRVTLAGGHAYVVTADAGMSVLDVSDPSDPRGVSTYYPMQRWFRASDVAVAGGYAYLATWDVGLHVIDISNPSSPSEVGSCDLPDVARGVAVSGTHAYVAGDQSGLSVVDVADSANPIEVGAWDTPGTAGGVTVAGNYAYVADWGGGMRVIDISYPSDPIELGFYDTPGSSKSIAVASNYAYVADGDAGLRVVNVTDPTNPMEVGVYDSPGSMQDVAAAGHYVYAADDQGGLSVIDVSDPDTPTRVGFFPTPGKAYGVAASGDYAYTVDRSSGLFNLRHVPRYSIHGDIRDDAGIPIAEVMVSSGSAGSATTDATGAYTITQLIAGTYVLTASKSGYEFSPSARVVRVPPDATSQDFTTTPVYGSLTGRITDQVSGSGVASARVSVAGRLARSDVNGQYSLTGLLPGLHNIYVSADGYRDYKGEATIEADTSIVKDIDLTPINVSGYYLPYPGGRTYQCTQGNGGIRSHKGNWYYAFDFGMRDGEQVVASRGGRVVAVKDDSNTGCGSRACIDQANYIRVRHADGTDTLYYHLEYKSAVVNENDLVSRGEVIAKSDTTGWCTDPHLDFTRHNWGKWESIPVSFADVPGDGVPETGEWYTSANYPTSQVVSTSDPTVDTDPPRGSVQFRFTGQPTHTLVLSAFDYITNVSDVRLAATEPDLQAANWFSFTSQMTWTEPAVFAQYRDANGNVSTVVSDTVDAIGYEPLQAAFVVSPTVCVGQGLSLTNQTTSFCEQCGWLWDFGDSTTSREAEPEFDYVAASSFAGYESPRVYTVALTATNAISVSSVSRQVEALSVPSADFTMIRSGETITVEAEATDVAGWSWDFGDGVTATGRIATHTYADPALFSHYPVQLAVEGTNGCTGWSHQYIPPYRVYLPFVLRDP